jgi:predicted nucleotidyltransferase component of viral defense system
LNPWLGEPKSDIGPRGATLTYRFESELPPVIRLRLKIEINTREHLCLLPIQQTQFTVDSRWFSGEASLPIYSTTELLGTKLRALYQRRKGRDLFDLWQAKQAGVLDAPAVADIFAHYMMSENNPVSAAEFIPNITAKMNHAGFLSDTPPLLRPGIQYNAKEAAEWLTQHLIPHIP